MVQVAEKTTVHKKDPKTKKYHLSFAPELIDIIKSGEKVKTYRFGRKYDYLQPGDVVTIENTITREVVGKARVTSKTFTTFKKLPLRIQGHETYKDKERQRKVFEGYYAYLKKPIKDKDKFIVLQFELNK